jgi:hypothetical protein
VVSVTKGPAQGFPTLTARCSTMTNLCYTYLAYYSHGNYGGFYNNIYNIYYLRNSRPLSNQYLGSMKLGKAVRVSDVSSWSHELYVTDYIDSFVTSRRYQVVWADRSDVTGTIDNDTDIIFDAFVP